MDVCLFAAICLRSWFLLIPALDNIAHLCNLSASAIQKTKTSNILRARDREWERFKCNPYISSGLLAIRQARCVTVHSLSPSDLRYAYAALFLICKISSCIILHTFVKPDCPLINFTFKWPDFPNRISKWLECKIAKHIDIHVEKECTRIKQNKIKCHAICVLCNAKRFFKSVEVFAGFTIDSGICLNHIWHIPMSATNEHRG